TGDARGATTRGGAGGATSGGDAHRTSTRDARGATSGDARGATRGGDARGAPSGGDARGAASSGGAGGATSGGDGRGLRVACMVAVIVAMSSGPRFAHADEPSGPPTVLPGKLRDAYERGDYDEARRILLNMYALTPEPKLLFALGQVELNLEHYDAAIRYYEKFLATDPPADQAALAQQAIGAARIKLAQPEKEAPPPPLPPEVKHYPPRRWYLEDTGFVAFGGLAIGVGAGLVVYSHQLGTDHHGTLSQFDMRLDQARTMKWTGIGVASAGALVVGVTVLRWRLRPDGGVMTAQVSPTGITVAGRW
ncbi:MAG TPA: tetratricopeptide repeat protein, partial [Kofleriaceae bacterium]|nr:tetratricopeptide repeat protein [Kofleriaceae bacterium]